MQILAHQIKKKIPIYSALNRFIKSNICRYTLLRLVVVLCTNWHWL